MTIFSHLMSQKILSINCACSKQRFVSADNLIADPKENCPLIKEKDVSVNEEHIETFCEAEKVPF